MAYEMTKHRKLSEIQQLGKRAQTRFRKLPKEHRVRVIEGLDEVTVANLKAAIQEATRDK